MAGCETFKYRNVTAGVFQALRTEGKQQGYTIPNAPTGQFAITAGGMSVHMEYDWDSQKGVLKLKCVKKPALLSCSVIRNMANQILLRSGGKPV